MKRIMNTKRTDGFTLINLLIAITIIAVVAAVIFIALDPATRFADARNAERWSDVVALSDAIHLYTIDNGAALPEIDGSLTMLGTATSGCDVLCGAVAYDPPVSSRFASLVRDVWFDVFPASIVLADSPAAWVSPTGFVDTGNQWSNEANAFDDDTGTYATNVYGGSGYGQFIEFSLDIPITSDRVRVMADYLDAHITNVDVDVHVDGAWVDVFTGGDEATWNVQWVELPFTKGTVDKARFRWNYAVSGFYYWLFEFQFFESAVTISLPDCNALAAGSVRSNSAILQATVNADGGEPIDYRFEYGTSPSYDTQTDWVTAGAVTGEDVKTTVTGLSGLTQYYFRGQLRNSAGTVSCDGQSFTTNEEGPGWAVPTSYSDPSGTWEDENQAKDDLIGTYARSYHTINAPQWSEFLYLSHPSITSDKIRFYALGNSTVDQIDIDVYKDDAWVDVYQGAFADRAWVEKTYTEGSVSQARIRLHATFANQGFFWQLYDVQFYRNDASASAVVNESECLDLSAYLTPSYIPEIPQDPKLGSAERTHYAVKKEHNNRTITVVSCSPELGETIGITE